MASGPIQEVDIDGRIFTVDGEVDAEFALPGYMNEVKMNGNGTQRIIKSLKPGRNNSIPIKINDENDDEEFIQAVMDNLDFVPISVKDVNNNVWSGLGTIVEDPGTSRKEGIKEINLVGNFTKQ